MNTKTHSLPISIIFIFIWVGFVSAISFLDAWLKFKAPGVTLPIGLGIGKLVFSALNKIEWVFLFFTVFITLFGKYKLTSSKHIWLLIPALLLVLQTLWLLPNLSERSDLIIKGLSVPPSNLHIGFIVAELIKVISLIIYGVKLLYYKDLHS